LLLLIDVVFFLSEDAHLDLFYHGMALFARGRK
jgi:hypothetical protein